MHDVGLLSPGLEKTRDAPSACPAQRQAALALQETAYRRLALAILAPGEPPRVRPLLPRPAPAACSSNEGLSARPAARLAEASAPAWPERRGWLSPAPR